MLKTINDLEKELGSVPQNELYKFIELKMPELCRLVKPGNHVELLQDGYFCSNCHSKLNEEEAWWNYCNYCLVNFDCCEKEDEPCDICGEKVAELVLETYKNIHNQQN